jgi:hypothetical protein
MKTVIYSIIIIVGVILLPISFITGIIPLLNNTSEGVLDVNWANPVGIKVNRLSEGDKLNITYQSNLNVSLYLITREEANEFRSPEYYKDPLPQPVVSGKNGSADLSIIRDGDFEILFLPNEASTTFKVNYAIDRDIKSERQVFTFSGIVLFLTSIILIVLGTVLIKRMKKPVMHK